VLGRKWESAEGTVIDVRFLGAGNAAKTANGVRYLVEVRPTAGAPFRVEVGPPALWGSYNGLSCRFGGEVSRITIRGSVRR
jgi:hypothetical protein